VPAELVRLLHRRTDGHPLFLTAMVDYLLRQGWVTTEADRVTVPVRVETLAVAVPDSLRQLIERQLAQCSPVAQRVLEAASVAGVEWAVEAVAAGCGDEVLAVEEQCGILARRGQFVQPSGVAEWPDGTVTGRYQFRHALYQQVLYDRVPAGRRVHLHRQIGMREEAGYGAYAGERAAVLAMHFDRGRDYPRAVRYLQQAADNALRRYAYPEATAHLRRGLEFLQHLPATPARASQELDMQMRLGSVLIATQGHAAPAVEHTYARAQELCRQVNDTPQLFHALRGLMIFYLNRAELHTAHALAEHRFLLAHQQPAPTLLLAAHDSLGVNLYHLGDFAAARAHFEDGIALYHQQQSRDLDWRYQVVDHGVTCLSHLSWTLWMLGYPIQALRRSREAVTLAQELGHPFSLAAALTWAAWLHHFRREPPLTQERAEASKQLSTEQGFPFRVAEGAFWGGWALAAQGHRAMGLAQMHQSLADYQATGAVLSRPYYLALLAEAYGEARQVEEGLRLLHEALTTAHQTGERSAEAELYRLRGELLLRQMMRATTRAGDGREVDGRPLYAEAEAQFQQALSIASRQHAKALELRAAMSLSRLWQLQGQHANARRLLAPIYGWFTEGFDTADLQEARALLHRCAGHRGL
jgi:predicted ATPase